MIHAVVFDLDGVIVSTDEFHYAGWKRLADEENIYFDRQINDRLRGVSRMESLAILLEQASRIYSDQEKYGMAARKNEYYRQMLNMLSPADILPGVHGFLAELKQFGIKSAIASSSKNTPVILERIGMANSFDAIADGNDILHSKPDPEVFLLAAHRLNIRPEHCLAVEDAAAGVEAALNAGMKVLAVGQAGFDSRASCHAQDLSTVNFSTLKSLC